MEIWKSKIHKTEDQIQKFSEFYDLLVCWLELKQRSKSLIEYFIKNRYHSLAIYGMKELGICLYRELEGTEIQVKYVIDKNVGCVDPYPQLVIKKNIVPLKDIDAIVVTAIHYFDEIEQEISQVLTCPIVSLEDVVYSTSYIFDTHF